MKCAIRPCKVLVRCHSVILIVTRAVILEDILDSIHFSTLQPSLGPFSFLPCTYCLLLDVWLYGYDEESSQSTLESFFGKVCLTFLFVLNFILLLVGPLLVVSFFIHY